MIEVRLFATFRDGREKIYHLPPEEHHTGEDIVRYLGIENDEVAIFLINGLHSKLPDAVKDGDVIALFPPVGGG